MRVAHMTFSTGGGAGIAARRLHVALREVGVDSTVHVAVGPTDDAAGIHARSGWFRGRARLENLLRRRYRKRRIFAWWSDNFLPSRALRAVLATKPDLLHFHWIGDAWIGTGEIRHLPVPAVWTMHDMWPFTGGCHYADDCRRFADGCGACPQLGSAETRDLSFTNAERKTRAWRSAKIAWVAPSRWLAAEAGRSRVLAGQPVHVIANGLDARIFSPGERDARRSRFSLDSDDFAVLVAAGGDAADHRKGAQLLAEALPRLPAELLARFVICTVGGGRIEVPAQTAVRQRALGRISDETELAALYSAADVFVLPSRQDNLPNSAVEAIACGCPVLGFARGGLPEIVQSGVNGALGGEVSGAALADTIGGWFRQSPAERAGARTAARRIFTERFLAEDRAREYVALYAEVCARGTA